MPALVVKMGVRVEDGGQVQGVEEEEREDKRKNKKIVAAATERTKTGIVITIPFCDDDAICDSPSLLRFPPERFW